MCIRDRIGSDSPENVTTYAVVPSATRLRWPSALVCCNPESVSYTHLKTPPGSLPFACDKTIPFNSSTTGWALFDCNYDDATLYETMDGGVTWVSRTVPTPRAYSEGGGFVGTPTFSGRRGAVGYAGGRYSLVYVTTNDGLSFHRVYPPGKLRPWSINVLSATRWRLAFRNEILGTNNGGTTWFTVTSDANKIVKPLRYAAPNPRCV